MNTLLASERYVLPQQREQDTEVWMPALPGCIPLQGVTHILKVPMGQKKKQEVNIALPLTHASAWHFQDCSVCSQQYLHLNSVFPMFYPTYCGDFYILSHSLHQSHLSGNSFVVYMPLLPSVLYLGVIWILKAKMLNIMLWVTPQIYIWCHLMLHLYNLFFCCCLYLIQKIFWNETIIDRTKIQIFIQVARNRDHTSRYLQSGYKISFQVSATLQILNHLEM